MAKKANFVIRNEDSEMKRFGSQFRGKYVIKVPQRCHAVVVSAVRERTGITRIFLVQEFWSYMQRFPHRSHEQYYDKKRKYTKKIISKRRMSSQTSIDHE